MLDTIYLANAEERKDDLPVVGLSVVGDLLFVGVYEKKDGDGEHFKLIERPDDLLPVQASVAVDLGDAIQSIVLLGRSSRRMNKRLEVEADQAKRRLAEQELRLSRETAEAAEKRFRDVYTKVEDLKASLEHYKTEHKKNDTEVRKLRYELAMERHKAGRGPEPERPKELDQPVPVGEPGDAEDATT